MLEVNSLVRIGLFDVDLTTVQANSADFSYLKTHFVELDTARIGDGVAGSAGFVADSFTLDTKASSNALGGQLLYVWAYKSTDNTSVTQSINTATHAALLTLNTSAWQLPVDPEFGLPASFTIDLSQLTTSGGTPLNAQAKIIEGNFPTNSPSDSLNTTHFGLIAIPEPSSILLSGVGLVGILGRRRRTA